jgi:hypothetical protein
MLQNYQETYMNFLGNFLKVFWKKKNARKLLILTKIRKKKEKKKIQLFFRGFSTKKISQKC